MFAAIRTILHPTDFSASSEYAFQIATALARDYGARMIVMHAAAPPVPLVCDGLLVPPVAVELDAIRGVLHEISPADSTIKTEHVLIEGAAASSILKAATESKCDLIVMGTHGRTGLGRVIMGSVAEEVVRKASCPVLTVKQSAAIKEPALAAEPEAAAV